MKDKNLIFLDIDGVFNCQLFFEGQKHRDYKEAKKQLRKAVKSKEIERLEFYQSQICKERLGWFNQLCEETNSVVVLSSTWRKIEGIEEILKQCGATFQLVGKTGQCNCGTRGCEIQKWLEENCKAMFNIGYFDFYRYAIIDDDSDMLLNQAPHFFQTDNYSGLTPSTCYKVKQFLTKKTF